MEISNKKQCSLCMKTDLEVSAILTSVQEKLHKLRKKSEFFTNYDSETLRNTQGFYRLIRVIFSNKFKHSKANINCRHQQVKKSLTRNLKCTVDEFNFVCDQLAGILGKFNFHVDTLIQQMKGFQRYLKAEKNEISINQGDLKQGNQQIIQKTSDQQQNFEKSSEKRETPVKCEENQIKLIHQMPTMQSYGSFGQTGFSLAENQFVVPMNYLWFYGQL